MKLGIDIGSTTVKLVLLNDEGMVVYSKYERHMSNVFEKVEELIEEMYEQFTDGCSTRDDYMNKVYEVLTTFRQEIAGLSYEDELAKLIG